MLHRDINVVRDCYAALRELVIRNPGGWDDGKSLGRVDQLCGIAIATLADDECHSRLCSVQTQARELYSREGHRKWARPSMNGADYLRLQMLIALEALNTRLFVIGSLRDQDEEVTSPGT